MFYAASHTTCSSIDVVSISFLSSAKCISECYMTFLQISEIITVVYVKHEIYPFLTSSPLECKIFCWTAKPETKLYLTVNSAIHPILVLYVFSLFLLLHIKVYIHQKHDSLSNAAFSPYYAQSITLNIINSNN